jgi:ribonuclease T1
MIIARQWCIACMALVLVLVLAAAPAAARATQGTLPDVDVAALPKEAQQTLALIRSGGPYPYHRDGVVFANREHLLPLQRRGYYHEYTVPTPGAGTRGARRVICGGDTRTLSECYYSDDHYQSFRRILQ